MKKRKYFPTVHSIERAREYFGVNELHAVDFVNDLAEASTFLMQQPETRRRIVYNEDYDVKLVLSSSDNTVITLLPPGKHEQRDVTAPKAMPVGNAIIEAAHATIKRELAKARRTFIAEFRKLKIEQAELGVEIAQANVNKVRCKAPHTQELIQQRIDASQTYYDVVGAKIERVQAEYNRTKTEAQAFLGTEVASV